MELFLLYLALQLPTLGSAMLAAAGGTLFIGGIGLAVSAGAISDIRWESEEEEKAAWRKFWSVFKTLAIIIMVCFTARVLIPSERNMMILAGAYGLIQVAKTDEAKEIGGKVLTIINQKLDAEIQP